MSSAKAGGSLLERVTLDALEKREHHVCAPLPSTVDETSNSESGSSLGDKVEVQRDPRDVLESRLENGGERSEGEGVGIDNSETVLCVE